MTVSKTIWLKRFTASILLGVWVLLHCIKVLHNHHAPTPGETLQTGFGAAVHSMDIVSTATGSNSADCSICDFHLSKNADHTIAEYNIQHPAMIDAFFPDYYSSYLSAHTTAVTGRGPPCKA